MTAPGPPWTPKHQGTPDGACTCAHEGYLARLSCGDESWSHGNPPVGGYISCGAPGFAHQSSYKVLAVRPGRPGALPPPYQGVLF